VTRRVTVVTPTVSARHDKLLAAIHSVRAQTFTDWTHMIVPNGHDSALWSILWENIPQLDLLRADHYDVRELGRPHGTPGHWNRVLAGLLAKTPYMAYLDDDNVWRPNHLAALVAALDCHPNAGFAYSQLAYPDGRVLGDGQIAAGSAVNHIDASVIVHRTELLENVATWDPHTAGGDSYAMDGILVDHWLQAGVEFVFVPKITVEYPQVGYWIDGGGAR
jgi:hypothetical protein